jgi:hypothetical protein
MDSQEVDQFADVKALAEERAAYDATQHTTDDEPATNAPVSDESVADEQPAEAPVDNSVAETPSEPAQPEA